MKEGLDRNTKRMIMEDLLTN